MSDIRITAMAPGEFGVQVEEGDTTSSHIVRVNQGFLDDLNIPDIDQELLVRESIGFLLDREPATAILDDFSLDQIPRYFPEYYDELRARLS